MKAIIGLGNVLKKDDNIGNFLVSQLQKEISGRNFIFIQAGIAPENYLFSLKKQNLKRIYFIDAAKFGGRVGEVKIFSLGEMVANKLVTTHNVPVKFFEKFFQDTKIKLIGVEVKEIGFGEGFSRELRKMIPEIISQIKKIIQ